MPNYSVSGRVVGSDGAPVVGATVTIHELIDLTSAPAQKGLLATTDPNGRYTIEWSESAPPSPPWDVFVRVVSGTATVESSLISDLESAATVDLVLGDGPYTGRSEWERVTAKVAPLLTNLEAKDVPVSRLEWLSRRADVFPPHLAAYVQAHRLANERTVKPESFYAMLRARLPADLPKLLRTGEAAWRTALRRAFARGILRAPGDGSQTAIDTEIDEQIQAMRQLGALAAVTKPQSGTNHWSLFATAGLDDAQMQAFMTLWTSRSGSLEAFWKAVRDHKSLGAAAATDLQFTIQATALVGNHVPALAKLQAMRPASLASVADLAAWDFAEWDAFLVDNAIAPPEQIPGDDATQARQNYAWALARAVEDSYPTLSLRHRIRRDQDLGAAPPNTAQLVEFFDQNPGFDITTTNIAQFVAQNPDAFANTQDPALARQNLELVQRVYRLTPRLGRYDTSKILLEQGIGSAVDVVGFTRQEFVEKLGSVLSLHHHEPQALAGAVWDVASKVNGLTMAVISKFGLGNSQVGPQVLEGIGDQKLEGNGLEELGAILGTFDYCACEHCRSVLGPAAYLADLLAFLDERSILDVLTQRRPDIPRILLDCQNTNTPLPYIDLVNEALEASLAGGLGDASHQTTWTAAELRLHPEHLDATVYQGPALTQGVFPWALPFSLPDLEGRLYLTHLGAKRHELMALLATDTPTPQRIATEALGLTTTEWTIIAGDATADDREFWGFEVSPATENWDLLLNGTIEAGNPEELLARGGLELAELEELIGLTFVDPLHYAEVGSIYMNDSASCQLEDAQVINLDKAALDRLHRFERLHRATKIPRRMLNVLIDDLGGALDEAFLAKLGDIRWLHDELDVAWDELATFWAERIDARAYPDGRSLYRRRFWAPELGVPEDFWVNDRGDWVAGSGPLTAEHVDVILAATGLREADYQLLAPQLDTFSFATLTAYFRIASFTRATGLPVEELLRLTALTGVDPFESPTATRAFVEELGRLRRSGWDLRELDWLLRHPAELEAEFADEAAAVELLEGLAQTARAMLAEASTLQDPEATAVKANLLQVIDPDQVGEVMSILDRTADPADEVAQAAIIDKQFASFMDPVAAIAALVTDGGTITEVPERFAYVLRAIMGHQRVELLVIDTLAVAHGLEHDAVRELLVNVLTDGEATLLEILVAYARAGELDAAVLRAHERFRKAAVIVARFAIAAGQIEWYAKHAGYLDLDAVPVSDAEPDTAYDSWRRLRDALSLRSLFAPDVHGQLTLTQADTITDALALLADSAGWDVNPDTGLGLIAQNLGWTDPSVFEDERNLQRLRGVARMTDRLGVSAARLWSWAHEEMTLELTTQIKQAARAKYDEAHWPDVARPLRDELREHQREVLVAALRTSQGATRKQLSDQLLIDIDMSACMLTSRIKQAISAIQTFVNRAMLGLEDGVSITGEAAGRWEWMKSFRVWEANRKVFLYPENWVEPQLRHDKTAEFIAFESALLQGELDDELVEGAVVGYLEGLDRLARLEIVSLFEGAFGELWVLACTQDDPRQYWVRVRRGSRWEPWELVPLAIQSDNVVLVARGRRVYLFWLMRDDATRPPPSTEVETTDFDHDRLTLAWSELRSSGWSEPRLSDPVLVLRRAVLETELGEIPPNRYLLKTINKSRLVEIRAYTVHETHAGAWPGQQFWFDPREKRISVGGAGTTAQAAERVSLFSGYEVDGQRFWSDAFRDFEYLDHDAEQWRPDPYVYNGTTWQQGPYTVEMLQRQRQGYARAFVLQSDHWADNKILAPSFFDDGAHKYLIKASPLADNAGDEDDDVDPGLIGSIVIDSFAGLDVQGQPEPIPSQTLAKTQIIKDDLHLLMPWQGQAPGVQAQLIGLSNIELELLPKNEAPQVLEDAKDTAGAKIDPHADDPNLEPDSEAVRLTLETFHHPFSEMLVNAHKRDGVAGLYAPTDAKLVRQSHVERPLDPDALDANTEVVRTPLPVDEFDFSVYGAYAAYNWELFFHAPLLIASKLTAARRFAEAQWWLHAIFNPIDRIEGPDEQNGSGLWRMRRFVELARSGDRSLLDAMLGNDVTNAERLAATHAFAKQVEVWLAHPFDPHAVAQMRPIAYMRAVVMKYLDNLIAWADELFARDSMESINEATILYMLAAEILGPRPRQMPSNESPAQSYAQLAEAGLDAFSNAAILLENWVYSAAGDVQLLGDDTLEAGWNLVPMRSWYFCVPPNPKLLGYWDTLEDRLWKLRHCQNIRGITRQLPLFQPPIDPALLVAAAAAGASIDSVLGGLSAGLPPYRFRHVLAKAMDVCGELRALGSSLLANLEKHDAEKLASLRAGQEVSLLAAARDVRVRQIQDIEARLESLRWVHESIEHRIAHYQDLIVTGLLDGEDQHQKSLASAKQTTMMAQGTQALASGLGLIPQLQVGTGVFTHYGGSQISSGVRSLADWMQLLVTDANYQASKALTEAQHERREQEWRFALAQAALDGERLERDIAATEIQRAIAERELQNHDLRMSQAREVDDYLRDKFTNAELYDQMAARLRAVYYQTFDLAFDLAKRAEAAYRRELAVDGGDAIVTSGYWESQYEGLLAGERLSKDLRRLEKAYMEHDVREYELRKDVSLARLDAEALRSLQETGACTFSIPELVFDLDHPGHYLRRLRAVSVTIPAVVETYASLGAKLTLLRHEVRRAPGAEPATSVSGTEMIATSSAVGDAGLFQLDFRDERYLPFEYAGAVSTWRLELPKGLRQFDYRTITDVVMSLSYTAREGGDGYRGDVENQLVANFNALFEGGASQLVVVHDMFPDEWQRLFEPDEQGQVQTLTLPLDERALPYFARRQGLAIVSVEVALLLEDGVQASSAGIMSLDVGGSQPPLALGPSGVASYLVGSTGALAPTEQAGEWTLSRVRPLDDNYQEDALDDPDSGWLDRSKIAGMLLVLRYELS